MVVQRINIRNQNSPSYITSYIPYKPSYKPSYIQGQEFLIPMVPLTTFHRSTFFSMIQVKSKDTVYSSDSIRTKYSYHSERVTVEKDQVIVTPKQEIYHFNTTKTPKKTGLMIVGWAGNNGSTLTASLIANKKKLTWNTKEGQQSSNYYGSITQASTLKIGIDSEGKDVFVPFNSMLPMVNPNDLIIGGWDINSMALGDAMKRAKVLDYDLQQQLYQEMNSLKPLPSIYYPDYIAGNQEDRADNVLPGNEKIKHMQKIQSDIRYDYSPFVLHGNR